MSATVVLKFTTQARRRYAPSTTAFDTNVSPPRSSRSRSSWLRALRYSSVSGVPGSTSGGTYRKVVMLRLVVHASSSGSAAARRWSSRARAMSSEIIRT